MAGVAFCYLVRTGCRSAFRRVLSPCVTPDIGWALVLNSTIAKADVGAVNVRGVKACA